MDFLRKFGLFKDEEQTESSNRECFYVYGFEGCKYCKMAACTTSEFKEAARPKGIDVGVNVDIIAFQKDMVRMWLDKLSTAKQTLPASEPPQAFSHRTAPFVLKGCGPQKEYVGGYTELRMYLAEKYGFKSDRCDSM